jgi:hypothetical protein
MSSLSLKQRARAGASSGSSVPARRFWSPDDPLAPRAPATSTRERTSGTAGPALLRRGGGTGTLAHPNRPPDRAHAFHSSGPGIDPKAGRPDVRAVKAAMRRANLVPADAPGTLSDSRLLHATLAGGLPQSGSWAPEHGRRNHAGEGVTIHRNGSAVHRRRCEPVGKERSDSGRRDYAMCCIGASLQGESNLPRCGNQNSPPPVHVEASTGLTRLALSLSFRR